MRHCNHRRPRSRFRAHSGISGRLAWAYARRETARRRDRSRRSGGSGQQSRSGLLSGVRRHQAGSGRLLPFGRTGDRQRAVRAAVHAASLSEGARRRQGAPEASSGRGATVGRDGATVLSALESDGGRTLRDRTGQRDLGRSDVHRRVPPLEQPSDRHREAGRMADRSRPGSCLRLRDGSAGRPRRPRGARRSGCGRLPEDQWWLRDAHLRADPARPRLQGGTPSRAGLRP